MLQIREKTLKVLRALDHSDKTIKFGMQIHSNKI